jgi:hypothetical protein
VECPKCGAENPEGAESCNLCFYRLVPARITVKVKDLTAATAESDALEEGSEVSAPGGSPINTTIKHTALVGGFAGVSGAWLIIASFSVLHFLNIRAFDFLFSFNGVVRGKLSLFVVFLSLFGLLVGGIAGNVSGKRAIVPASRVVAAAIGLSLWTGLLQLATSRGLDLIEWLSQGWVGALATLATFPIAAAAIGACEAFGEDWSGPRALAGAIGGLVAGFLTAGLVANTYIIVSVFGTVVPDGFWPVTTFGAKLVLITGIFSFVGGASLWLAIEVAERYSS